MHEGKPAAVQVKNVGTSPLTLPAGMVIGHLEPAPLEGCVVTTLEIGDYAPGIANPFVRESERRELIC